MKNRLFAALIGSLLIISSNYSFADNAKFYVDGMSCPFCTFGLEKKLNKIDGVSDVKITLKTGEVRVFSSKKITKPSLHIAVKDAGFSIRKNEIFFSNNEEKVKK